jgi:hypothetical protein
MATLTTIRCSRFDNVTAIVTTAISHRGMHSVFQVYRSIDGGHGYLVHSSGNYNDEKAIAAYDKWLADYDEITFNLQLKKTEV